MWRVFWVVAFGAIVVAGCAGQTIKDKMAAYPGQPASAIIDRLGFPSTQQEVAGRKVYVWATNNFVDGTNYKCQIRTIVDERDTIITWDYEGNEGGCASFAARLSR